MNWKTLILIGALGLSTAGCQTMYNTTMEKVFGVEKRQLLKKSVEDLRQEQKDTQAEFKDALTRLKELYSFQGGKLEDTYNKLKSAYEDAKKQADEVHSRIDNMEGIAKSMFSEWEKEIGQYENPTFAQNSRQQLTDTKARYNQMSASVKASAKTMEPVLKQLSDHVLYLKHNLNAASIGSLKGEATNIQAQIDDVVKRMNDSIAEADAFIKSMTQ